jgi:cholesterol 7-dehydrogenase
MNRFLLISAAILAYERLQFLETLYALFTHAYVQYGFGLFSTFAYISIPLIVSSLIDWKLMVRKFSCKNGDDCRPQWEAFVMLNWIFSGIFTLSMAHSLSKSMSGKGFAYTTGLFIGYDSFGLKPAMVLVFLSVAYLIGFLGVSGTKSLKVGLILCVPPVFELGIVAFAWTVDTSFFVRSIICVVGMIFFAAFHMTHRVKMQKGTQLQSADEGKGQRSQAEDKCNNGLSNGCTKYKLYAADNNAVRNLRQQFVYDLIVYISPITLAAIVFPRLRPMAHGLALLCAFFKPLYMSITKRIYFRDSPAEDDSLARERLQSYPHPALFPNGWYNLVSSCELKKGDAKYVAALGKHYAVFRGQDGVVRCLDAHCIHMGANMAVGGKVKNNCLECPFHLWQFDGDGACTHIPYSKAPSQARTRSYHVREYYGNILVWYHTNEEGPAYDPPVLDKFTEGLMIEQDNVELEVNMHIQEFAENSADYSHFGPIHGQMVLPMTDIVVPGITINHSAVSWKEGQGAEAHKASLLEHADLSFCGKRIPESAADPLITFVGPGSVVYFTFDTPIGSIYLFQTHTPITPMRLKISFRWFADLRMPRMLAWYIAGTWLAQWRNDIPVFESKKYQKKPMLVKGDGPMQKNRKWFSQFYTPRMNLAYEAETSVEEIIKEPPKEMSSNPLEAEVWRSGNKSDFTTATTPAKACAANVVGDW